MCDFIGICELKIVDKEKYQTVTAVERDSSGKPAVRTIEMRCRVALPNIKRRLENTRRMGDYFHFTLRKAFIKINLNRKIINTVNTRV